MSINKDLKNFPKNLKGALTDAQPVIDKLGNSIGNTTVSYTHLTLPTIYSV